MEPSADMAAAAKALAVDARISEVAALTGGSSASVVMLDLLTPDAEPVRVVFRQHTDRSAKGHDAEVATKEFSLLERLHVAGLAVPAPLAVNCESTVEGSWLLMEWIDGAVALATDDLNQVLVAMADFLARLHAMPVEEFAAVGLEPIEDPSSVLDSHLTDDGTIERRPNSDVLLHGDFWPGNIMFRHGELVAVIDWEDAKLGDPLADLACARVEIACAFGVAAAARFTGKYLARMEASGHPLVLFDLPIWDVYVSTTALSAMHLWGLPAVEERSRRIATRAFYESAAARLLRHAMLTRSQLIEVGQRSAVQTSHDS